MYGRNWTKWEDGGTTVTTYSAPDGTVEMDADAANWSKMEFGTVVNGFPGLPYRLTRKDGSGVTWDWTIVDGGTATVEISDGVSANGSLARGTSVTKAPPVT